MRLRKGHSSPRDFQSSDFPAAKPGLKAKNAVEILLSNFLKKHFPSLCDAVTKDQIEQQLKIVRIARPLIQSYLQSDKTNQQNLTLLE